MTPDEMADAIAHNERLERRVLATADLIEAMLIEDVPGRARGIQESADALVALSPLGPEDAFRWALDFIAIPLHRPAKNRRGRSSRGDGTTLVPSPHGRYPVRAELARFVDDVRADSLLALAMPERAMEEPSPEPDEGEL
jgi:hypothetical protein